MAYLDDKTRDQVREALEPVHNEVELLVFTGGRVFVPGQDEQGHVSETLALLREVAELSDKVDVSERPYLGDEEASRLGVVSAPTILFREKGSDRGNIRFMGLPSGYEFATVIEAILMLGKGESGLGDSSREKLAAIAKPLKAQVFVTPTCPYCPQAVLSSFRLAYHNPNIVAIGVEASEFPSLAQRYRISGVPDSVIQGETTERLLGGQPDHAFVDAFLKAAGSTEAAGA